MNPKGNIVVVGFGWVGQANAVALVTMGYQVAYFDSGEPRHHYRDAYPDQYRRINRLATILAKDGKDTCYIVAVGDRVNDGGVQDISLIENALDSLKSAQGTIVLRSTVLPEHLSHLKFDFYMPEFLHEKNAIEESIFPYFVVVGAKSQKPEPRFFKEWRARTPRHFTGTPEEASYIKYLSNLWNAVRIAFVNEFGDTIATPDSKKKLDSIERVINFVTRGDHYLRYGRAYSGHCLPKDMRAFTKWCGDRGRNVNILSGVWRSNDLHEKLGKEYPVLPEWYSAWPLPHLSGFVALRELWYSIRKNLCDPRVMLRRYVLKQEIRTSDL